MQTIKRTFLCGLFALGMTACGGDVAEVEKLADEMCACKTAKCAEGVEKKMDELGDKLKDKGKDSFSKSDQEKLTAAGKRMMKCALELTTEAAGSAE